MSKNQKTAIVTGAGSGIGLAVAKMFVQNGINVIFNGRTTEKLDRAILQINQPVRTAVVAADITKTESAELIVNEAVKHFGQIDILINNAGIFHSKPFTAYTVEEIDVYLSYLRGTFVLTQEVVRLMQKKGLGGSVVNVGTALASSGIHKLPSSAPIAAKGGIMSLTKNLSVELAAENIRINTVAPGIVYTPMLKELSENKISVFESMQPLGRCGTPEEIAKAILFLVNSTWITGTILHVDGGINASSGGSYAIHK